MRLWIMVLLYCLLVVILQVVRALSGASSSGWGSHHYAFFPVSWLMVGLGIALLFLLLGWFRPWRGRLPFALGAGLLVVAGSAGFWLARQKGHFLGDGLARVESLRQGVFVWDLEPLGITIPFQLGRWFDASDPTRLLAGLSVVCGVLFLLFAVWFARIVTDRAWETVLVLGLVMAAGFTRLFYGYVEIYPLLALVTTVYLVLGVRYLRGKGNVVYLALAGSLAFLLHTSALCLLPSLVYLCWHRRTEDRRWWWSPLLIPAAVLAAGHFYLNTLGTGVPGMLAAYRSYLLPGMDSGDPRFQFSFLSPEHLLNIFEAQFLIGPFSFFFVGLMMALGAGRLLGHDGRFLIAAGLPWFLFSLFFNHGIGPARQWDVFASAAIAWVLLSALLLMRLPWVAQRPRRAGILTGLVLGVSVLHTLPWIAVGMDEDRSLRHFAGLYGPGSAAAPFARSYAFDGIGTYYLSLGQVENAEMAYKEAVTADTTNAYAAGHLGSLFLSRGRHMEAAGILNYAVQQDSTKDYLFYELANAQWLSGNPVSAMNAYRQALKLNPDFVQAYLGLASLQRTAGQLDGAEVTLVKAARRFPDHPQIVAGMALVKQAQGDSVYAVDLYENSLELDPTQMNVVYNLGVLLLNMRRYEQSIKRFEVVVARNPKDVEAWINLASAREGAGLSEPALEALEQALYLDAKRPEVYFGIFRNRLAAGDTAQAVLALRVLAGQDSTSQNGRIALSLLRQLEAASSP